MKGNQKSSRYHDAYIRKLEEALIEVKQEVERAKTLFPDEFVNQHEAYGVITEEWRELEKEVFKNQKNYDLEAQRQEAKQLAAMCLRFMVELT